MPEHNPGRLAYGRVGCRGRSCSTSRLRLDVTAAEARGGEYRRVGPLSLGERFYVAPASSQCVLLQGDSIAYALSRIGTEGIRDLIERHQYDS